MTTPTQALVARVRHVNEHLNPNATIASRGNGSERLYLTHGDIEALCALVDAREGDAARLDLIQTRGYSVYAPIPGDVDAEDGKPEWIVGHYGESDPAGSGKTLREALDAARGGSDVR